MAGRRGFILSLSALASLALRARPGWSAALQSYDLLEFAEPRAGLETEFDRQWQRRLAALVALPGFRSATPLRRADAQLSRPSATPLPSRLALFSIEAAQLATLSRRIGQSGSGQMASLSAADPSGSRRLIYRVAGSWTAPHQPAAGDVYRQLVMTNAMPGEDRGGNHE
jgi:hypothetical protein